MESVWAPDVPPPLARPVELGATEVVVTTPAVLRRISSNDKY